jgi:hypothetical protein
VDIQKSPQQLDEHRIVIDLAPYSGQKQPRRCKVLRHLLVTKLAARSKRGRVADQ